MADNGCSLALQARVDDSLDRRASVQPVGDAPDSVTRLEAFAVHLAGFHPRIRTVDLALLRASETDPDVAQLVDRGGGGVYRGVAG
jgi:hypothetical protein